VEVPTAEIRRGKKERRKKKPQDENIMVCPIPQGDHNYDDYISSLAEVKSRQKALCTVTPEV